MKFNEFINKYNNKYVDFDGAYGGQCVDLFRMFVKEVLEIEQARAVNGAKNFWTNYSVDPNLYNNFLRIKNTLSFVPQKGDIAVWYKGTYGHIAICTGNGDTRSFEIFEQNRPLKSKCHLGKDYYRNFYGVLRPKNQNNLVDYYKVIVDKKIAMVRSQPNSNSTIVGSKKLNQGDVFQAVGTVFGESVNGNNIWYKSKAGNYVWSGGIRKI